MTESIVAALLTYGPLGIGCAVLALFCWQLRKDLRAKEVSHRKEQAERDAAERGRETAREEEHRKLLAAKDLAHRLEVESLRTEIKELRREKDAELEALRDKNEADLRELVETTTRVADLSSIPLRQLTALVETLSMRSTHEQPPSPPAKTKGR